jgi:hypothetical protein
MRLLQRRVVFGGKLGEHLEFLETASLRSRRYSSGGKPSIADSISSTRPMLGVSHYAQLDS